MTIFAAIAALEAQQGNYNPADFLGTIRDAKKALERIETVAKASFDGNPNEDVVTGCDYKALIVEKVDWRLDTKGLKEEFGEDWYNKRCKQILSRSIRTSRID